jgi:hypothetical protein
VAQSLLGLNNKLDMIERAFHASPNTEMHIRASALFHVASMEKGVARRFSLPEFTTDIKLKSLMIERNM